MFEPTPTWPNVDFRQLFMWIEQSHIWPFRLNTCITFGWLQKLGLKKSLSDCFHILYVDWYRWEDAWEARWAQSDYLWATQAPPEFFHIGAHIWKTGDYFVFLFLIFIECFTTTFLRTHSFFCFLVINLSALLRGLSALKFSFTWVRRKAAPGPPKYEKKVLFFHILGLNLKMSYQIASLFHMYIDMGGRIAGKQDRVSLIIENPLRAHKIPPKYTFFLHFGP